MIKHEINGQHRINPNLSIRDQHEQWKNVDRLTRSGRIGRKIGSTVLALTIFGGAGAFVFHETEPGAGAVRLPNITTASGLRTAEKGVRNGKLVEVMAIAPGQSLDLKDTDLLDQPRDFSSIALDSTETINVDSSSIEAGLIYNEVKSGIAQPNTPYFVPTTPRSLELHNLEKKSHIL